MSDMKQLLERARREFPPPDRVMETLSLRRDRKRRNQRIAAGVVGLAVFLAVVLVLGTAGLSDRTQAPAGDSETGPTVTGPLIGGLYFPDVTDYVLDLETGAKTPLPESIVGTVDVTTSYAVSPDGSRLAYVGPDDNREQQIFVANLDGSGVEQVTSGGASHPAWSPDGTMIAYLDGGDVGDVFVLDLGTGVSTRITNEPRGAWASTPTFSPDGTSIMYGAGRYDPPGSGQEVYEVRSVPVTGGKSVLVVGGDGVIASQGALSPDGSLLSYHCHGYGDIGEGLCLANADGTDARVLVASAANAPKWSPDGSRIAYWTFRSGLYVVDVATGEVTTVSTEGAHPVWIDDHTLLVEADYCNARSRSACPG